MRFGAIELHRREILYFKIIRQSGVIPLAGLAWRDESIRIMHCVHPIIQIVSRIPPALGAALVMSASAIASRENRQDREVARDARTRSPAFQFFAFTLYYCRIEERDYRWRRVSKACNQRSRCAHGCIWTPCIQNKRQPRKKPLTLAGWRDSSRSNDNMVIVDQMYFRSPTRFVLLSRIPDLRALRPRCCARELNKSTCTCEGILRNEQYRLLLRAILEYDL